MFDKNKDGKLEFSEIKEILGSDTKNSVVEAILNELGSTKESFITYEKFKEIMLDVINKQKSD
jgi:Ca2+-binding EF-hand superfamily protein